MVKVKGYSILQKYLGINGIDVDVKNVRELILLLNKKFGINLKIIDNKMLSYEGKPFFVLINGHEAANFDILLNNEDIIMLFPVIDGG
ncbi:MAG: hypothetical protein RXR51_06740 [Nitrososphaeria archaeon]|jgi:molybdopterin converting factor small subunit